MSLIFDLLLLDASLIERRINCLRKPDGMFIACNDSCNASLALFANSEYEADSLLNLAADTLPTYGAAACSSLMSR